MEPKNTEKQKAEKRAFGKREELIATQWRKFSETEAFQDWMEYSKSTSEMLTAYAKEGVMPSPISDGEQVILTGEKALSLLQNARGCDIILSYAEQYIESATSK